MVYKCLGAEMRLLLPGNSFVNFAIAALIGPSGVDDNETQGEVSALSGFCVKHSYHCSFAVQRSICDISGQYIPYHQALKFKVCCNEVSVLYIQIMLCGMSASLAVNLDWHLVL